MGAEPCLVEAGEARLDNQAVAEKLTEVPTQRVAVATHEAEAFGVGPLGRDEGMAQEESQRVLTLVRLAGGCRRQGHSAIPSARHALVGAGAGRRPAWVIARRKPPTVRLPNALRSVVASGRRLDPQNDVGVDQRRRGAGQLGPEPGCRLAEELEQNLEGGARQPHLVEPVADGKELGDGLGPLLVLPAALGDEPLLLGPVIGHPDQPPPEGCDLPARGC